MPRPTTLVLNWHLTETCNYQCRYCYAAWSESHRPSELICDARQTSALLGEIYRFFQPGNPRNPLARRMGWTSLRLNLAGGEPLIHSGKLMTVVNQAHALGFEVSLITNGSYLTRELLDQLAPTLSWLGISIDSGSASTNLSIGRADRRGHLLDLKELATNLHQVRQHNLGLRLKLNTVVNSHNHREDLAPLIQRFYPDKWKVLRMLPVVNRNLAISDQEFTAFVARHRQFGKIICPEDNQDMRDSYLMIDPHGRFFQNSLRLGEQGYTYSQPILGVGIEVAFSEIGFDPVRFNMRYIPTVTGE